MFAEGKCECGVGGERLGDDVLKIRGVR